MANQYKVSINRPMADALRRFLIHGNCPLCDRPVDEHSWIVLTENGKLVDCSNWQGGEDGR